MIKTGMYLYIWILCKSKIIGVKAVEIMTWKLKAMMQYYESHSLYFYLTCASMNLNVILELFLMLISWWSITVYVSAVHLAEVCLNFHQIIHDATKCKINSFMASKIIWWVINQQMEIKFSKKILSATLGQDFGNILEDVYNIYVYQNIFVYIIII